MTVVYQAEFQETSFIRTMPDGNRDTCPISIEEISQLEKTCRDFKWNRPIELSRQIGKQLFDLLNGDRQTLIRALKEADAHGKELTVVLNGEGPASALPFELLYHDDFLVPSRIHLIRKVSDRGEKSKPAPENRPLRLLLMACSPLDVNPVLEFEKEEETIFEVTKDLPMGIDIEDSGSIEGLGERLATNKYDVVHITGHADIDENGEPFFWMEDDEGLPIQVTPLQLWEKLDWNLPRLVFLSGCRTGEAPEHLAAMSFAHRLVKGHIPAVLGWGLPVSDVGASLAAQKLYFELSRGENIPDAVLRTRRELIKQYSDWSILRLFSDGSTLDVPLVTRGQRRRPKPRELQYIFLANSQVKVLKKGFIGRRRQIQQGIKCLRRRDGENVGLLLYGTGGLGKSCLAGKLCDRFKDNGLIIVHGVLNAITFRDALEHGFKRAKDDEGLKRLEEKEEMPDKIERLCYSAFLERNYLIVLDDFEKNLVRIEEGRPEVCPEAVPILESLLRFLPSTDKMTQLIITSRYTFPLTLGGEDLVQKRLESIGLTTFRDADERKKVSELENIASYPDPTIKKQLIEAGRGNPRLMEALNTLVGEVKDKDLASLLTRVKGKQEEFVQGLVLNRILKAQTEEFQTFLRHTAVFRLPVLKEGISAVCGEIKDWNSHVEKAVRLSLMEMDSTRQEYQYLVTPLMREKIIGDLEEEERKKCHQKAVSYYQSVLSIEYTPILSVELIEHAIKGKLSEIAIEEGCRFLPYLRESLAYREGLAYGNYIVGNISELKNYEKLSTFYYELGYLYFDAGNPRKSIDYFEQALCIYKEYGDRGHMMATCLNNIGTAWHELGNPKQAIDYYEKALSIHKEIFGERFPNVVAARLSNIGNSWMKLGDTKKAMDYFDQAFSIYKKEYGERHQRIAICLNNFGRAWIELGDPKKAMDYYEKALSIDKEVSGEKHPDTAIDLAAIGSLWIELGDTKKAVDYLKQALSIFKEVYGDRNPRVTTTLCNIGMAWEALGDPKKCLDYYEQALSITKEAYGERHPDVALALHGIGMAWYKLGYPEKSLDYYEQALSIIKEAYGDRHPNIVITLNDIATAWDKLGDQKKAIDYYMQALSFDKKVYGERHLNVARDLNNIGASWYELGDSGRAREYLQQAYNMCRELVGEEHEYTKGVKQWLDGLSGK